MRAILIDTPLKTISEVAHNGDYRQIYEYLGATDFNTVRLTNQDFLYVDGEGLLKPNLPLFSIEDYDQPLAGRGLILGIDPRGETVATTMALEWVSVLVTFRDDIEFSHFDNSEGEEDHPILGRIHVIRREAKFRRKS